MLCTIRFTLFNSFSASYSHSRSLFLVIFLFSVLTRDFGFINIHCCLLKHPGPLNSFTHFNWPQFFTLFLLRVLRVHRSEPGSKRTNSIYELRLHNLHFNVESVNPIRIPCAASAAANNNDYYCYYRRNTTFIHITIIMEFKCGVIFQTNKRAEREKADEREREWKQNLLHIFLSRSLACLHITIDIFIFFCVSRSTK